MKREFNIYGEFETPEIVLCQPTGEKIQTVSHAISPKLTLRFNSFYDLEFQVPKYAIINGEDYFVPYYALLSKSSYRQVKVDGYGTFVIDEVQKEVENDVEIKTVYCKSIDYSICKTDLVAFKGTYRLYDQTNPYSNETIIGKFLKDFDGEWSIVEVDSALWDTYRTYDISEMNWYEFLHSNVEQDFQCVFVFNTDDKTIKIKTTENAIKKTDISISKENLLKKITVEETDEGVKTCLYVRGADGIDIREVNPLGSAYIYNLDYYCDPSLMIFSNDTIQSYQAWKTKYSQQSVSYKSLMLSYKNVNKEIIQLNTQLTDLNHQLDDLKNILSVRIEQGLQTSDIRTQLDAKESEIATKKSQIKNKENELNSLQLQKDTINQSLNFKSAFTSNQWKEVSAILKQTTATYTNPAFAKTDLMSDVEVQEKCESLFDLAVSVLSKKAKPRHTFTSEVVNFLVLEEFGVFSEQLEMGCEVALTVGDETYYPILLEYTLDFESISNSVMTFCDDLRLMTDAYCIADIMQGVTNTVVGNGVMSGTWADYVSSGDKNNVNSLIRDPLDLANKTVLSSTGQAPTMDATGIWARKKLDNGNFDVKQLAMLSNGLYMTDSNWSKPARLAIGEIEFGGIKTYGIATDLLVGNFIVTKSLMIKNAKNTFTVDENGFTATNGSITLKRSDGNAELHMNPTDGIKLKSKINNTLQDVFYFDGAGNLNFKGNLTGASGEFSGTVRGASFIGGSINIENKFTVDKYGNCVSKSLTAEDATFRRCKLTGGSFEAGSIDIGDGNFTVSSSGRVDANNIHISGNSTFKGNMNGGSIDIKTDAEIGSRLYLSTDARTGIYTRDGGLIWGARNGMFSSTIYTDFSASVDGNVYATGQISSNTIYTTGQISANSIYAIGRVYSEERLVATQDWCNSNFGSVPSSTGYTTVAIHNHGITDGTVLRKADGGNVTYYTYDGDDHRHPI